MDFAQAVAHLKARGQKLTPQRLELLRILMAAQAPLSAQDVYQQMQKSHPHVSLDTIYRNLTMLTATGLVGQVNLQNKEIARFEFQGHAHHHHAICLGCGKTLCIDDCPAPALDQVLKGRQNFKVVSHAFEVYGYCSDCH